MKLYRVLVLLLLVSLCQAQPTSGDPSEAEELFRQRRYVAALPFYLQNIKASSVNANDYYRAGVCYLRSRSQKTKSVEFFEKAITLSPSFATKGYAKETEAPADAIKWLGDAYHLSYRFEEAIVQYERYKEILKAMKTPDPAALAEIEASIQASSFSRDLKESVGLPPNFKMASIIKNGSSEIGDFSSALSPDKTTMVYTLKVPVEKLRTGDDDKYFEDGAAPVKSQKDSTPEKAERKKNKENTDTIVNITTVGTSVDGQVVLTYRNDNDEGNLYITRLKNNKWTPPAKLPKTANLQGWEHAEFVTTDGNYLYFVSDRKAGYGGKDIYRCKRLPNGQWSKAQNLGPEINTEFDDVAPFMHSDGTTFYFSSNRHKPTLGFEVFTSTLSADKWSKPMVVGYPVNSSDEQAFYQVGSDKKKVLAKAGATPADVKDIKIKATEDVEKDLKKDKKHKKDSVPDKKPGENYVMSFENETKSGLTLLKGQVLIKSEKTTLPLAANITLTDNETDKQMGIYSADQTGYFTFVLTPQKNTGILYEAPGYLFRSENRSIEPGKNYFEKHKPTLMPPLEEGATTQLMNVFFEENNSVLKASSNGELNRVYTLLEKNPGMKIKLTNCMYTKDKSQKKLSEMRAEAVMNYLVEKGINKKRIEAVGERKTEMPDPEEQAWRATQPDPEKMIQRLELQIDEIKEFK